MLLNNIFITVLVILFISISYTDIKFRIVHNSFVVAVFILSLVGSFVFDYQLGFYAFFVCFIVGILLWRFSIIGAGDVKLIMAYILSIPYAELSSFFLLMSIIGFVLAFICICLKSKRGVPYAVAISGSHLIVFYFYYF